MMTCLLALSDAACGSDDATKEAVCVTGCVRLVGNDIHLPLPPIRDHNARLKGPLACRQAIPDERLLVDPKSKGIANVFVWVRSLDAAAGMPDRGKEDLETVRLTWKACQIHPHVACIQTGQPLVYVNEDKIAHNPHERLIRNSPSSVQIFADQNRNLKRVFEVSEIVPFQVTCDFHPNMAAYILVQDHPYMALTRSDGTFQIKNIPAGHHEVAVWHEAVGYIQRSIEIDVAETDLSLKTFEVSTADLKL